MQAPVVVEALKLTVVVPTDQLPLCQGASRRCSFRHSGQTARESPTEPQVLPSSAEDNGSTRCRERNGARSGPMSKADEIESAGISTVLKQPKEEAEPRAEERTRAAP